MGRPIFFKKEVYLETMFSNGIFLIVYLFVVFVQSERICFEGNLNELICWVQGDIVQSEGAAIINAANGDLNNGKNEIQNNYYCVLILSSNYFCFHESWWCCKSNL